MRRHFVLSAQRHLEQVEIRQSQLVLNLPNSKWMSHLNIVCAGPVLSETQNVDNRFIRKIFLTAPKINKIIRGKKKSRANLNEVQQRKRVNPEFEIKKKKKKVGFGKCIAFSARYNTITLYC